MKKFIYKNILLFFFVIALFVVIPNANAESYMSDKTEMPVNLEISGVESVCQTSDGYVWIGQFSGLIRYDSNEFVTYNEFSENNTTYEIINVTKTVADGNTVYIATSDNIIKYENNKFSLIFNYKDNPDYSDEFPNEGKIKDFTFDYASNTMYICTVNRGLVIYDLSSKTKTLNELTKNKTVYHAFVDKARNRYFYHLQEGIYKSNGEAYYNTPNATEVYTTNDMLFIGENDGDLYCYSLLTNALIKHYNTTDQINKILYSPDDELVFVACDEKGLYCFNMKTDEYSVSDNLENKSNLVDLMLDYEGNLWVASRNVTSSGLSIITKNAISSLLDDDPIWNSLAVPPSYDRNIYATEKVENILYLCTPYKIYLYDLTQNKILENDVFNTKLEQYFADNGITYNNDINCRDIEVFNNKIYFASYKYGLVEYDPETTTINVYGADYIQTHLDAQYNSPNLTVTNTMRCLRAFDGFLAIGYTKGIMKFDGTNFIVNFTGSNVMFIQKDNNGKVMFNRSSGLFVINNDFSEIVEIETEKNISGNRLRFLVDDNKIYYTLNSRLFRLVEGENGNKVSKEVIIPYIKGSIVNIEKIKTKNADGDEIYEYIVVSQSQAYITDNLDVDKLENYELLDSTNGFQSVITSSSGFYDEEANKYYFQTTNGVFVYDFGHAKTNDTRLKVAINSVNIDGNITYGNQIKLSKNAERITFNFSIFSFKPNNGYKIYYKLDGVDKNYIEVADGITNVSYTNLKGGKYNFHFYVIDENNQKSNVVNISVSKTKHVYEHTWFMIIMALLFLILLVGGITLFFLHKIKLSKKRELEYKKITLESIEAIARTIDVKDSYTNGHSRRVGYYSREIAKAMGLPEKEVENIFYTALLHDIGKIGIPIKIINKPARLDDEEFAVMKTHTTKGGKILKDISTIPGIVEGAVYHHEKYNGTGYPTGLKGKDIPLNARIICCADCFDAMATKRSYKEPCTKDYIINEFERCKGTQFDPEVADVIIKLIKEDKFKTILEEDTSKKNDDIVTIEDSKSGE